MKYDIKKAMREHPDECEMLIREAMTHAHMWGSGHDAATDRIRETCRVQTVKEAKEALVDYALCSLDYPEPDASDESRITALVSGDLRRLTQAIREAREREGQ